MGMPQMGANTPATRTTGGNNTSGTGHMGMMPTANQQAGNQQQQLMQQVINEQGPQPQQYTGGTGFQGPIRSTNPINGRRIFDSWEDLRNAGNTPQAPTVPATDGGNRGGINVDNIDYNNLPQGIDPNAVRANPQGYLDYQAGMQAQQAQPSIFNQSAGAYTDALGATRAGLGVQPNNIRAAQVRAGQVGTNDISQGMSQYQNPYEQQVVDNAMKDIERQRQMQVNQVGSQATAAGAFGGSRQGVAEAETNRAALEQQANTAAQLRSQGFAQAADLAGRDIQNRQNVDLANQSANLGASTFNAGQLMQSQLANQSNLNQYANRLMSGGSQLGSLSNLGFNMGNTLNQNQMQAGNQQQALMQALINAGRNQTQNYYNSPQDALNALIGAYSGSQTGQQSQKNTKTPGLFDFLSLGMQF
jgi:hypothetical protein